MTRVHGLPPLTFVRRKRITIRREGGGTNQNVDKEKRSDANNKGVRLARNNKNKRKKKNTIKACS